MWTNLLYAANRTRLKECITIWKIFMMLCDNAVVPFEAIRLKSFVLSTNVLIAMDRRLTQWLCINVEVFRLKHDTNSNTL